MTLVAQFTCAVCGRTAGTLSTTDDGMLVLNGFIGVIHSRLGEGEVKVLEQCAAFPPDDVARVLHPSRPMWVPWYCPQCDASYCNEHWSITLEFEDDDGLPAWYDCARGTCPAGHERLLDD